MSPEPDLLLYRKKKKGTPSKQKRRVRGPKSSRVVHRVLSTRTHLQEISRCSGRGQPKMLSCAYWTPGNRPCRALAPVVRAWLRGTRLDRAPITSTLSNYSWAHTTVSRAASLEGPTAALRRCLWTDTTITYHLGNVKHRHLSQEPARKQPKHAADGNSPDLAAAAAAAEAGGIGGGGTGTRPPTR